MVLTPSTAMEMTTAILLAEGGRGGRPSIGKSTVITQAWLPHGPLFFFRVVPMVVVVVVLVLVLVVGFALLRGGGRGRKRGNPFEHHFFSILPCFLRFLILCHLVVLLPRRIPGGSGSGVVLLSMRFVLFLFPTTIIIRSMARVSTTTRPAMTSISSSSFFFFILSCRVVFRVPIGVVFFRRIACTSSTYHSNTTTQKQKKSGERRKTTTVVETFPHRLPKNPAGGGDDEKEERIPRTLPRPPHHSLALLFLYCHSQWKKRALTTTNGEA